MEKTSQFSKKILILLAGFILVCGTWFAARTSTPEPWQVNTAQRPMEIPASAPEEDLYPDSLLPGETIDINTADVYDLQRLPGIGEKRAQDIIAYREAHGPFQSVEQLEQVSGIGPVILENLREYAAAGNE
ncbi:MAG: ComEA family DNA-binding protein [Lawsonibacter sp.]|nr:ComEA family DNA-binding protein [Lawsonibacter sp.]